MALPVNGSTHLITSYYSFYRPRNDERLSWPSWLTCSGWLTHISGHPSAAGRAQDRESSPVRDRRSTTVPRQQPHHQLLPCFTLSAARTAHLHHVGDGLALGQYLGEVLGAEHVAQRGLGRRDRHTDRRTQPTTLPEHVAQRGLREQTGRVVRVLDTVLPRGGSVWRVVRILDTVLPRGGSVWRVVRILDTVLPRGVSVWRVVCVLDVRHRHGRVADPVVDDGVHGHSHRVFRQHLTTIETCCYSVGSQEPQRCCCLLQQAFRSA